MFELKNKKNFFLFNKSIIYKNIFQRINKVNSLKKKIRLKKIFYFFYQCGSEFFNKQYQLYFNIYIFDFLKIKQFFLKKWLHWFVLSYFCSFQICFLFKQFFFKKNCFFNFLIFFKRKNIFYGNFLNNCYQDLKKDSNILFLCTYKYIKIDFLKKFFFLIMIFFFLENFFKKFSKISKQLFLLMF